MGEEIGYWNLTGKSASNNSESELGSWEWIGVGEYATKCTYSCNNKMWYIRNATINGDEYYIWEYAYNPVFEEELQRTTIPDIFDTTSMMLDLLDFISYSHYNS